MLDYIDSLDKIKTLQNEQINILSDDIKSQYKNGLSISIGISIFSILASILIAFMIKSGILRRLGGELNDLVNAASEIADCNLSVPIIIQKNDDHSLLNSIKKMRDNLDKIVSEVKSASHTISKESAEISFGSSNLSSRTEQQAASLEETASSMEEMTSTVKENSDNIFNANKLSTTVSALAIKGGSVVNEVINTMQLIDASSKKISDIISVIEGIAFQTNILALNAAVEAARAGEQGKGFAVVAAEVRNLSQRSSAAAKEITSLINDSVQKVKIGRALVGEAGSTIGEVVEGIQKVTKIMSDIAIASKEQSSGINQINNAIGLMDQGTQKNAILVEEASTASAALEDQAKILEEIVSVFRLNTDK